MNKKLRSILWYFGMNGVLAGSMYYGVGVGIPWAANTFMFFAWAFAILGLVCAGIFFLLQVVDARGSFDIDAKRTFVNETSEGWTAPVWLDIIYDVVTVGFLVYHGWIGYSLLLLVQYLSVGWSKYTAKQFKVKFREEIDEYELRNAGNGRMSHDVDNIWDEEDFRMDDDDDLRRMGVIDD